MERVAGGDLPCLGVFEILENISNFNCEELDAQRNKSL